MQIFKETSPKNPIHFTILIVPNFSLIAFASVVETLRLTNRVLDYNAITWEIVTKNGLPEKSSCNIEIHPNKQLQDILNPTNVIVCSGINAHLFNDKSVYSALRLWDVKGAYIGGVCTASYILASAGLLKNYCCTLHWASIDSFIETFPEIRVKPELFVFDKNRFSCAGGTSAMDMILYFVKKKFGKNVSALVADQLIHQNIRESSHNQRIPLHNRINTKNKRIIEAIGIMEKNIENNLSRDDIAKKINISPRQLERLFKKYLDISPAKYYLQLRLQHAKFLLEQTTMSIIDISVASGFSSASHFSKCYRDLFKVSPRQSRNGGETF